MTLSALDIAPINAIREAARRTVDESSRFAQLADRSLEVAVSLGDERAMKRIGMARKKAMGARVDILVTGAYKSGKTTVVNGLLGRRLIPAELLTGGTAPISVVGGEEERYEAVVVDDRAGRLARAPLEPWEFADACMSPKPTVRGMAVERLVARYPHPLLDAGIRLVDTPGFSGGLSSLAARRVLQIAHQSSAAMVVTDGSQELSRPELEFMSALRALGTEVLVVMTRIDVANRWTDVLTANQQHLETAFESPPPILAVGAGLQYLAARTGDESLDRESGFPLLAWYLALNLAAPSRFRLLGDGLEVLSSELEAATVLVEGRLEALVSTAKQESLRAELRNTETELKELKRQWSNILESRFRALERGLDRDLTDRLDLLRTELKDRVGQAEEVDDWPVLEGETVSGANRLLVDHLLAIDRGIESLIADLANELGIDGEELATRRPFEEAETWEVTASVAEPNLDRSDERIQRIYTAMRSSVLGASAGATAATFVVKSTAIGLLAAMPIVGLGLGAGGLIGVGVLNRLQRNVQQQRWRQQATSHLAAIVDDAAKQVRRYSLDVQDELRTFLRREIPLLVEDLVSNKIQRATHLERLLADAQALPTEAVADQRRLLERVNLIAAHAERLSLRLSRPELDVFKP